MLTRLKVSGFKNLVDVDVRFGPFTCVAGPNGVGKSNLFDAIKFLSSLADKPLMEAALSVRDEGGRTGDVRSLFHRAGDICADRMLFEAEMIVPRTGIDDLGQVAKASITFLRWLPFGCRLVPSGLAQRTAFTGGHRRGSDGMEQVYARVANRLSELMEDVREVWVDRDEKRELLTLHVRSRDRTAYPARALSDGTLRFLALTVLELDSQAKGLLCLEEPENGIHPQRIPAMLELLQDIVTDVNDPVNQDNPLRQVIVNTHSPAVVAQVPDDSLLVAESRESISQGRRYKRLTFSSLADTWRTKTGHSATVARGRLQAYLTPVVPKRSEGGSRRVVDRPDLQLLLPLEEAV